MTYLASSLHWEFSISILKLNVMRSPDMSLLFYSETLVKTTYKVIILFHSSLNYFRKIHTLDRQFKRYWTKRFSKSFSLISNQKQAYTINSWRWRNHLFLWLMATTISPSSRQKIMLKTFNSEHLFISHVDHCNKNLHIPLILLSFIYR